MPTWGHKRLVWHPADVLWPASVELYSNTVSISQYKYDSPRHIRTSCIDQQHLHTHLPIRGPSLEYSAVCWLLGSSKYVIKSHSEETHSADLTRLFTFQTPSIISGRERQWLSVLVRNNWAGPQSSIWLSNSTWVAICLTYLLLALEMVLGSK